jgi:hypothetical protein
VRKSSRDRHQSCKAQTHHSKSANQEHFFMRTISQALSDPMFTVVSREEIPGIIKFKFGKIPAVITVKIWKLDDDRYTLDSSHGIRAARQKAAYWVCHGKYASPGEALDDFRSKFHTFYASAVRQGFRPSNKWLVPDRTIEVELCAPPQVSQAPASRANNLKPGKKVSHASIRLEVPGPNRK